MPRANAHREGTPHRIAVTYVENDRAEILVQVRARGGAHDHSSAGHVDPGDSYIDTAKRELAEELGITDVELTRIGHGISREQSDAAFKTHVFDVFVCSAKPGELQASEVAGVYWADPNKLMLDMSSRESRIEYAGGFRASLPIYVAWRGTQGVPDGG
jgi:8-oxo-dGTP pyrophosphatase MutT (NUDIX family)